MKRTFLLPLLVIACLAGSALGATINASSCAQSAVQSAINSAAAGDTIVVPSGSCSYSSPVTINKAVTVQGQTSCTGAGSSLSCSTGTTISAASSSGAFILSSGARLTGFNVVGGSGSDGVIRSSYDSTNWRVDHNYVAANSGVRGVQAFGFGLVDHNRFYNTTDGVSPQGGSSKDAHLPGDYYWSQPLNLGSSEAVYIEDNFFDYTQVIDGAYDSYDGVKLVFRFNYVKGTNSGSHGLDSSGTRSTLLVEEYNNVFVANPSDSRECFGTRGGVTFFFNNDCQGTNYYIFSEIRNYRGDSGQAGFGNGAACNGSNYIDGNVDHGYPCRDQVGRGPSTAPSSDWTARYSSSPAPVYSQAFYGAYFWSNTYKGSSPSLSAYNVAASANNPPDNASQYQIINNRDFYVDANGGVKSGPLSSRPSTCAVSTTPDGKTTGPAYWATDQGSWNKSGSGGQGVLYRCTATNTWSVFYTPYTYPHPLQSSSGSSNVQPPTNLNVVVK